MRTLLALVAAILFCPQDPKAEPFAKDIAAYEAKDKTSPPPENEIVFVGSSSIRMWKSTEAFPDLKVINRGFGGSQMSDSVKYAERIILPYKPRIVVVFAGGNDINASKTPEQVAEDFRTLAGKIHAALPKTKVYYISLFPNVKRKSQDAQCQKANELVQAFTKTDSRLGYIDTATKMRASDGGPRPELLRDDGLHMNDDGYKIWNEIVGAVLRKPAQ
jgi:lysophospholipase L1-like esterase